MDIYQNIATKPDYHAVESSVIDMSAVFENHVLVKDDTKPKGFKMVKKHGTNTHVWAYMNVPYQFEYITEKPTKEKHDLSKDAGDDDSITRHIPEERKRNTKIRRGKWLHRSHKDSHEGGIHDHAPKPNKHEHKKIRRENRKQNRRI